MGRLVAHLQATEELIQAIEELIREGLVVGLRDIFIGKGDTSAHDVDVYDLDSDVLADPDHFPG